ncbi:MAG: hypothetical protein P8Z79_04620 [Sedimentisphaerales bacterium]|jgi:hypothetical protein
MKKAVFLCVLFAFLSEAGAKEFCADLVVVNANAITVDNENHVLKRLPSRAISSLPLEQTLKSRSSSATTRLF